MKLGEIIQKLPPDCHHAMREIWTGLDAAEGANGPNNGTNYIKLLSLVQCEIANRVHNAASILEEQL